MILTASHFGFPLSTTHVASGAILGTGVGVPGAHVRWRVAGRMVVAWLITLVGEAGLGIHGVMGFYALGIRATAAQEGGEVSALRRGAGYACFAVCFGVIIFGIRVMRAT